MAKFKILKEFRNKETQEIYPVSKEGESVELSAEYADKVVATLGKGYIEKVEEAEEVKKDTKAKAKK